MNCDLSRTSSRNIASLNKCVLDDCIIVYIVKYKIWSTRIQTLRVRICLFHIGLHRKNIQYEKYKLQCYIMKRESLSKIVSYKNIVVNQTDTYKI